MKRLLIGSFVALALVPAPAAAQVYPERVVVTSKHAAAYQRRARDDSREQQSERTTRTFRLGDGGWLALSNIAGDITITRGGGAETTVEIVKTARGRDAADARDMLQAVTVEATERAGRAEVKTHYPGDGLPRSSHRNFNVSVAYTVTTPAGTRVAVDSISGNVRITDIKGDVTANTISGDVRVGGGGRVGSVKSISGSVEIVEANVDGPLEANSVSGDVTLRRVTARRVQTGSVSGNILMENMRADRVEAHTTSGNITFSGQLAKNGRYELNGFSGEVRVALSGGTGFELDANTFSGQIRSDDFPVTSRGRISGRHLTGTWGDGSAVLELKTFSGSIAVSKQR